MRSDSPASNEQEPVAIIGIGCRFPGGADSPDNFWKLLRSGTDAMVDVPAERWDWRRFYDADPDKPGKMYIRQAGFLREPLDQFDAQFFGISPREAARLDPQQRLLLEVTWEAIEDAGLQLESLKGSRTGVFVGGFTMDNTLSQMGVLNRHWIDSHTSTSGSMTLLSNRISHAFDFRGPSVSMDTACSASLVALHYACRSLWNDECSLAVTGGANVISRPEFSIVMSKGKFLARDGRCKTFDARADGYGRGEGAGVVILKRLSRAVADGDPIWALVRGTGVNQDGHTPGIFMPNRESQESLLREVYGKAGIEPEQIQYVEAHGTGTLAGDIAEATAIGTVVSTNRSDDAPCVVGSVKTNIGHLEAAAGVAGVIKTVLCLKHRAISPHLHFESPNPDIPFDKLHLHVPKDLEAWPETDGPRLAGVNSFGYGGTNAHALLEAYDAEPGPGPENPILVSDETDTETCFKKPVIIPISARDRDALAGVAGSFARFMTESDVSLPDLYHSLWARRTQHPHRLAMVASSRDEIQAGLAAFADGEMPPGAVVGRCGADVDHRIVFVYTGMGPQWPNMGRELMATEPVFREAVEQCDALFSVQAGWSLLDVWMSDDADSRMDQPEIAQPANFMLQVGLTELWRSRGLAPSAVVGHSVGEVTSAYVAGVLTLEQAVQVSYHRSRLQQKANGQGKMLATGLSAEKASELLSELEGLVSIASINSASSVVLSGDGVALEEIAEFLDQQDVFQRFLQVEVAYHSYQMDPLRDDLLASLKDLAPQEPNLPIYSTVTGAVVAGASYDAEYWWENVRQPVNMAEALTSLVNDEYATFVEVGPHPVLNAYLREAFFSQQVDGIAVSTLHRKKNEQQSMMET
ncbi:MAG: type I polyketide synthase, partial [Candidatus Latescibacteria bacterium]|nr:type I polyketide synthase [Candidatus Latescibacterota bacterium]